MRHLMLLALSFTIAAHAAVTPYATQLTVSTSTGTSATSYWVDPVSSATVDSIYCFDAATKIPKQLGLGNLTIVSGSLMAPSGPSFVAASPARSFNTPWQATANLLNGKYSIKISTGLSIAGGAEGEVYADQADDSGFTTNVVNLGVISNGQTGTLVVGLAVNQTITLELSTGFVPSGKYLRLRTNNVTGTPTYTLTKVRESTY